jgi:hypothetical protein
VVLVQLVRAMTQVLLVQMALIQYFLQLQPQVAAVVVVDIQILIHKVAMAVLAAAVVKNKTQL